MQNDWRQRGRRGLKRIAGSGSKVRRSRRELAALRERVAVLEDEVKESRRLNRRLAELTDVVQELLLPEAQRDDERLSERLEKYTSTSF
jgi:predicted RNase H-like nuclease (RuvC/YqgF family)